MIFRVNKNTKKYYDAKIGPKSIALLKILKKNVFLGVETML